MSGWLRIPLDDIFDIARGGSPRPIDKFITDDPAGVNWIMIGDAAEGSKFITHTKKRIRPEGVQRSRRVKPGDFLLTNSMSFGRPYILRTNGCIHDGWLVLSPRKDNVDADFFYYLLGSGSVYAEFQRRAAGATVKNLNIDLVRGVTVALPPLPEQRRIAAILDKADALRAKRRAALAQLDTLTQSIFLDMFGDPISNTEGWKACRLEEVATTITDGTHKTPVYTRSGIEFLSAKDLKNGGIAWGTGKFISEQEHQELVRRCNPELGDILLAKSGSLGNVAIIDRSHPFSVFESLCLIKHDRDLIDAQFLVGLLRAPAMLAHLLGKNKGVAIKHLHLIDIRSLRIALPPIALQRAFAQRITSAGKLRMVEQESLAEFDAVFASLQHRAFRGEL